MGGQSGWLTGGERKMRGGDREFERMSGEQEQRRARKGGHTPIA